MKKALIVATNCGFIAMFEMSRIKLLQKAGYEVHCATNWDLYGNEKKRDVLLNSSIIKHQISFSRKPVNKDNIIGIRQIKHLLSTNNYDIVHCHTPIAAMCTRLACRKARKKGTKVIYTAHGFHFFKGAPFKNWLLYYPVEKLCAYITDALITINKEDFTRAKKHLKAKEVVYVPGVGIDLTKFGNVDVDRTAKRRELGLPEDAVVLLSVGELNKNKNHETVIRAIADMDDVYYMIAGVGELRDHLQNVAEELGISHRVQLLGYRSDIGELNGIADIFVMPSFREGLPVSLMEAMICKKPCVVSKIRGNTDLIDENGGAVFSPFSIEQCKNSIEKIVLGDKEKFGEYNAEKVKAFSIEKVSEMIYNLYKE